MAQVEDAIRSKLHAALAIESMVIENESDQHSGPAGRESHFKITLVSEDFNGLMPVKRHQKIYALLAEEKAESVHALALHLYTPKEWQSKNQQRPDSPACLGVGR